LQFGIEKRKIAKLKTAQAAHRCHTRWRQISPANIAMPAWKATNIRNTRTGVPDSRSVCDALASSMARRQMVMLL
jgi:hypothetical protein